MVNTHVQQATPLLPKRDKVTNETYSSEDNRGHQLAKEVEKLRAKLSNAIKYQRRLSKELILEKQKVQSLKYQLASVENGGQTVEDTDEYEAQEAFPCLIEDDVICEEHSNLSLFPQNEERHEKETYIGILFICASIILPPLILLLVVLF